MQLTNESFWVLDKVFWPAGPFFGSGVVISQKGIPIGLQNTFVRQSDRKLKADANEIMTFYWYFNQSQKTLQI